MAGEHRKPAHADVTVNVTSVLVGCAHDAKLRGHMKGATSNVTLIVTLGLDGAAESWRSVLKRAYNLKFDVTINVTLAVEWQSRMLARECDEALPVAGAFAFAPLLFTFFHLVHNCVCARAGWGAPDPVSVALAVQIVQAIAAVGVSEVCLDFCNAATDFGQVHALVRDEVWLDVLHKPRVMHELENLNFYPAALVWVFERNDGRVPLRAQQAVEFAFQAEEVFVAGDVFFVWVHVVWNCLTRRREAAKKTKSRISLSFLRGFAPSREFPWFSFLVIFVTFCG